jgi:hypothetical protein
MAPERWPQPVLSAKTAVFYRATDLQDKIFALVICPQDFAFMILPLWFCLT